MIGGGSVDDKETSPDVMTSERVAAEHLMNMIYTACTAALTDFFAKQQQAMKAEMEAQRSAEMQRSLLDKKIRL